MERRPTLTGRVVPPNGPPTPSAARRKTLHTVSIEFENTFDAMLSYITQMSNFYAVSQIFDEHQKCDARHQHIFRQWCELVRQAM